MNQNEIKSRPMSFRLTAIAATLLFTTPSYAQVDADCTGSNPGTVTCPGPADTPAGPAIYADGVTHATNGGDLTVNVGGGVTSFGTGGFNTTATGDDSIVMTKGDSPNMLTNASGTTASAVIGATTQAGDISITTGTGTIQGVSTAVQYGINAESTGGGDISMTTAGNISTSTSSTSPGIAGIRTVTNGGNINLSLGGSVSGRAGVLAQTSGDGLINVMRNAGSANLDLSTTAGAISVSGPGSGSVIANTSSGDITLASTSAISATLTTSSGLISVNAAGGSFRTISGNDVFISTANASTLNADIGAGSLTTHLNGPGTVLGVGQGDANAPTAFFLQARGGGDLLANYEGGKSGQIDLSGLAGSASITISGKWRTSLDSTFGSGDTTVTIAPTGVFTTTDRLLSAQFILNGLGRLDTIETTTLTFGEGDNRFINQGTMLLGARFRGGSANSPNYLGLLEAQVTFENLDTFENSGIIFFGDYGRSTTVESESDNEGAVLTDGVADDMLLLPGAQFIGSGNSTLFMDVDLNAGAQMACNPAQRGERTFSFELGGIISGSIYPLTADCMSVEAGSTEGSTKIRIAQSFPGDRGAYDPDGKVLVDVSGGTSAAEHFVIDPLSADYNPVVGTVDKGFLFFPLVYDAETQQHKLLGLPSMAAYEQLLVAQAAQDLWRQSTAGWLSRQADLRSGVNRAGDGGAWFRTSTVSAERDAQNSVLAAGTPISFDNSYQQNSLTVTLGLDLFSGGEGDVAYGGGVQVGYVNSRIGFDASPDEADINGFSFGAYGSYMAGGFFLDAVVNSNIATVRQVIPAFAISPTDTRISTDTNSLGLQVETGWRMSLGETLFIEPQAGLSYVNTQWDETGVLPADPNREGVALKLKSPQSLRGSLGGRVGLDQNYGGLRVQYTALARYWNEFRDDTRASISNIGPTANIEGEQVSDVTELGLGASLYGAGGKVSGFFNVSSSFGDYSDIAGTAGMRVLW